MKNLIIDPKAFDAIKNFKMPPLEGFGRTFCPIMVEAAYENGNWGELKMRPYGPISLDPFTKVLHYGQEIFEGMKAYKVGTEYPLLFRPDQNFYRFNHSAKRMGMPALPEAYFYESIESLVSLCSPFIPEHSGQFLYIRPFMFASEVQLGVQPSSKFRYMVLASPTASYFSGQVQVYIERQMTRAAPGGTGNVKTGGNYANSVAASLKSQSLGFQQVLWLDAFHKRYIEELSAMNFFAVKNGTLYTPALTDTILPGITRDSILYLAKDLGIRVFEERMDISELIEQIKNKECTEAFACGTASIVAPIACLGEASGERFYFAEEFGPVTKKIRQTLLDIQEGRQMAPQGWVRNVLSSYS